MSDYIKITEVVARAKAQLRLSSAEDDARLQIFIEEGARSLGTLSVFRENYDTIDVVDNKAELPCGFYKFLGVRPVDEDGCYCNDLTYVDTIFANQCCCDSGSTASILRNCCGYEMLFKIIGNYIHLHSPTTATKLQLAWLGYNTNDEGLIMIEARYERALANYAMWMEALSPGSSISRDMRNEYRDIWIAQKEMIRGQDQVRQWDLEKYWIGETLLNRIYISPRI